LGTPSGRCDEHSSKFFPQLETKVYRSKKKKPIRLKVMLASLVTAPDNLYGTSSKLCFASSNVEPAHNTTKYFVPNLRDVVNLTGLLETKGMSISSGKQ
jgi:hypothetical protein